ncbi:MAG TPA: MarR family winged helix-turn-helix transcriptional regulator [Gemmatimonadaceae bacterium]|nr:MarR family winged helix-turn-helix transcriptional regulator [Gemmatimonadaceae bacterium]
MRDHDVSAVLDGIRCITRALRVSSREAEQRLGVSGAQLFVLQQLAQSPARSLNELAQRTRTDQSSASVVVSRLVARGLVAREVAVDDGRRVTLRVTPAGRAIVRRAPAAAQARLVAALERLPRAQVATLARALAALGTALERPDGAPGDGRARRVRLSSAIPVQTQRQS